jgi:hypothetical protein
MTRKPRGYWTEENILKELNIIINKIGHFPTSNELKKMGKQNITLVMCKNGGAALFRELTSNEIICRKKGYWSEEITISELKKIIIEIGRFPSRKDLENLKKEALIGAMQKNGGEIKLRRVLNQPIIKLEDNYWNNDIIVNHLNDIIQKLSHFPSAKDIENTGIHGLKNSIKKTGGLHYYRKLLGYKHSERNIYKTELEVQVELDRLIKILNHYPTEKDIKTLSNSCLISSIRKYGGHRKFKKIFNLYIRNDNGFWTDEKIVKSLEEIISKVSHFPTEREIDGFGIAGLSNAIMKHGGYIKFRELCGISVSDYQYFFSNLMSYTYRRGKNSEKIVLDLIKEWCKIKNKPEPICNVKVSKGNVIEFICENNKTIGIDVVNTSFKQSVYHKWERKEYSKYLDKLLIVVFSDCFDNNDYEEWNNNSPDNVIIMSINDFIKELDYSVDKATIEKIECYKICSFRTKDELKKIHKNEETIINYEDYFA